jgi:hypothetical protein
MAREVARLRYILPAGWRYEVELNVGTLRNVTHGDLKSAWRMQFLCFRDLDCIPIFPSRWEWCRMVDIALTQSESVDVLRRMINEACRRAFRPLEPGEMEKHPLLPPHRAGYRYGQLIKTTGELNGVPRDIFRRRQPADA